MTAPPRPWDRSTRMSDADYPGTLRLLGDGWRVVVCPDGRRYRLQPLVRGADGEAWASPPSLSASSLPALLQKCAALVEGLPDDPALALPELVCQRQALLGAVASDRANSASRLKDRRADFFRQSAENRAVGRGSRLRP